MNNFSAEDSIKFGWETFKKRPWFFIGVAAILLVISSISSALSPSSENFSNNVPLSLIGFLASLAISTLIDMGVTSLSLKASSNTSAVKFEDLWHPKPFWKYLAAAMLTGLVVVIGFIFLIVPGVLLALMLMFVKFLVIDRNLGPIEAIKESARVTKGYKWKLFVLLLLIVLINIVGFFLLFIGLLVSIPVSALAVAHAYRTLSRMHTPVQSA